MSYTNPIYHESCPDPFILKYCGEYFCYATGWSLDGRAFPISHSTDLITWTSIGGAMDALPEGFPEYWAPEAIYSNGRFYLYYSVGNGVTMRLRVAIATSPKGPFQDAGHWLADEDFAIDAHVFQDDDGARYLFYAKDFLVRSHIGTGTVMDRMIDELTLEGNPRPVSLPRYDWQVFDQCRAEKGGVRWHTVEGPFVLKYKGCYYQMFSGGNWKNLTYGVSYAIADSINAQREWTQLEHNEELPLVLATIPGKVIGPGHNSVIRGPDNRQLYCVYHRWAPDESARLLSVDPLEFIGNRLSVFGPSVTPQENPIIPQRPLFSDVSGTWEKSDNELLQRSSEANSETSTDLMSSYLMIEVSLALFPAEGSENPDSRFGAHLYAHDRRVFSVGMGNDNRAAEIFWDGQHTSLELPPKFSSSDFHLLRIEANAGLMTVTVDDNAAHWRGQMNEALDRFALFAEYAACSFKACSITYGFEDRFFCGESDPARIGWVSDYLKNGGNWKIFEGEALQTDEDALNSMLVKEHPFSDYELTINARLIKGDSPDSCYGFYPAITAAGEGPLLRVVRRENTWRLAWNSRQDNEAWLLPDGFDPYRAQQFRFRKYNGHMQVCLENKALGMLYAPDGPARAALYAHKAKVGFDLVRLTSLECNTQP